MWTGKYSVVKLIDGRGRMLSYSMPKSDGVTAC
jgi:hypothetical protein